MAWLQDSPLAGVYELPDFISLLIEFSHVRGSLALIDGEFFLRAVFLREVNIILAETVVRVREVGVEFERTLILRD